MAKYGPARHVRDVDWLRERVTVDPATGCWEWRLTRNHRGYGLYNYATDNGIRTASAHRLALTLALGRPIKPGLNACHHCDNPPCCNGAHLFEGTTSENAIDRYQKGRVHCSGEINGLAKLTWEDIDAIQKLLLAGVYQRVIAQRYGVDQAQISRIKNGKAWTS